MPDKEEKEPALQGMAAMVAGSRESKQASFPVAVILLGVVVLGFAFLGFLLVRSRRKAAKLAYELRKKEEEHLEAAEAHRLAKNAKDRQEAHNQVSVLEEDILGLKKKLAAQKAIHEAHTESLSKVSRWDDLVVVDKRE